MEKDFVAELAFVKMHGLGNDYVYIDVFANPAPADPAALARRIADRHRGVGGDGLILVEPSDLAAARMRMFNADGSESEMCGNGVRCVAHLVVARGYAAAGPLTIETGRGVLDIVVSPKGPVWSQVKVDMGPPILTPLDVPVQFDGVGGEAVIDRPCPELDWDAPWVETSGIEPGMTCVSMGNPHAVFYCRDVESVPLEQFGPTVENHPAFPRRTNVHVVQVVAGDHVRVRTWERGSGITQACGTGASAVCVAGVLTGRSGRRITATLPGGDLLLEWPGEGAVFMTGPAEEVFTGLWHDVAPAGAQHVKGGP
ncbi:MAG: diaminopimelate epimerase [Pirellulales bacterium]